MYPKTYLFTCCLVVLAFCAHVKICDAQDIHFSQYQHSAHWLSPTEVGNYFGDWRFVNNYRNQWAKIGRPTTTLSSAYDRQIYIFNQKLSVGGQFVHDESGDFLLVHQKFMLAAAYHQTVGYHTFRIGIQGGLVQKRLNSGGYSLPDQWDQNTGSFNNQLPTAEPGFRRIIYYPDFNVGVSYGRRLWKLEPEVSFALFHINRPNESFMFETNRLAVRKVLYIKVPVELKGRWSLDPQFLYMWQRKSVDFIAGSLVNYDIQNKRLQARQAFLGLSLRNSVTRNWDAFIVTGGLQFKHIRAAISYDITVSKLRVANSYSGAVEVALIYTGLSSVLQQRAIPCRRY